MKNGSSTGQHTRKIFFSMSGFMARIASGREKLEEFEAEDDRTLFVFGATTRALWPTNEKEQAVHRDEMDMIFRCDPNLEPVLKPRIQQLLKRATDHGRCLWGSHHGQVTNVGLNMFLQLNGVPQLELDRLGDFSVGNIRLALQEQRVLTVI